MDLHQDSHGSALHISVVAPIFAGGGKTARPVGALILLSHADKYLYPLIQSWPAPSKTAETLLVRRDGDHVLFLNELRHRQDTALKLRIPLSQTHVPAVMAVLGQVGLVEGKDYRDVDVISAVLPIPGSPWFMVAKMDTAEAFADWQFRSLMILALLFGIAVLLGLAGLLARQRREKKYYRGLYRAEAALRISEQRYAVTLKSIGDAVIATDAEGNVELLNAVAETMTGWPIHEAKGKPLQDIFHIVCEDTGAEVENPVHKVLAVGKVVGLANHTLLIARDGVRRPIDDSAAPIRDEQGQITGVVLVFHDRTEQQQTEQELLRVNERMELAQKVAGIGVWDWDEKTKTSRWSQQMYDLFGLDPNRHEPSFKSWLSVVHPDDKQQVIYNLNRAFNDRSTLTNEYRINKSDGKIHWIYSSGKALVGKNNSFRMLGTCVDITDRKRVEEEMLFIARKWQTTFDSISDPVALLDEDCIILQCNSAYVDLTDVPVREIIGQKCFTLMHHAEDNIEDCPFIRSKQSLIREEMEMEIDGRDYLMTIDPIIDRDGHFSGAVHIIKDITVRKQMEEALRESEEKYRLLFDTSLQGILVADIETRKFVFANKVICGMLGYTEEELRRLSVDDIHPKDSLGHVIDEFQAQARGDKTIAGEIPCLRKDGSVFYADVSASKTMIQGKACNLGFFMDVTEKRKSEEEKEKLQSQLMQAQKMESVGRLAGGVAHDFNNMLSLILGHAELAMEKVAPEDTVHADLLAISKAARRSADLTRQLLAFARKQTIAPKILDVNDTVGGMLKMLQRLIGEDIDLAWRPGADLWPVKVDPGQIDQILANLCVNARDAMDTAGRITIETENVHLDKASLGDSAAFISGDYVRLVVSDNGSGMDKTTLSHLFEPFFTTKDIGHGTGLGLATVYGIVKQNSGFINVYSEPGNGTSFKIYLPRHSGEKPQTYEETAPEITGGGQGVVLLVEDEPMLLELGKMMLEKMGLRVLSTSKPEEALQIAEESAEEIDLLMTDVVMPGMNGRELANRLVARYPKIKQLFMSGYTANVIAHRGVLDEGVEFIQKPFSIKELSAKINEILAK